MLSPEKKNENPSPNPLSAETQQEQVYKKTMLDAKQKIEMIDAEMQQEIEKSRKKLTQLKEQKKSYENLYRGASDLLAELPDKDDKQD